MKTGLTDSQIRTLPGPAEGAKAKDYSDKSLRGLVLRVHASGSRSFLFRYSLHGKQRSIALGEYGKEASQITLKAARERVHELKAQVAKGIDPAAERKAALTPPDERVDTVQAHFDRHIKKLKRKKRSEKYLTDLKWQFKKHCGPIAGLAIESVTPAQVDAILVPLAERAPTSHNRLVSTLGPLFKSVNPNALKNAEKTTEKPKATALSLDELRALFAALDEMEAEWLASDTSNSRRSHPTTLNAVRLAALTLKRAGEIAGIRMSEIEMVDGEPVWVIPPERVKKRREDRVPLSGDAYAIIQRELDSGHRARHDGAQTYVFPSPSIGGEALTPSAISKAYSRAKKRAGIDNEATLHRLRATGLNILLARDVEPAIAPALLGHQPTGITFSTYTSFSFLKQRRHALEYLAQLVREGDAGAGSNVTPLRPAFAAK